MTDEQITALVDRFADEHSAAARRDFARFIAGIDVAVRDQERRLAAMERAAKRSNAKK